MKKYPFIITIFEDDKETISINFTTELDAKIEFERLKVDKDNCFDMFLSARQEEDKYEIVETFINKKQHNN